MGREQMRNLETYKIGDSQVNEFEYQKNQGEMTEQLEQHPDEAAKGKKKPTQAERVKQITAEAHKKVEKRRKKEIAKTGHLKKSSSRTTLTTKQDSKPRANAKSKNAPQSSVARKKMNSTRSVAQKPAGGGAKQARKKK